MIPEWGHVAPCFCYHCPFDKTYPGCNVACADDLHKFLRAKDASSVAAFLFEPVVGATLGAAPAVGGYTARIAEICRQNGILVIADEVMTGMGRTGKPFASSHWGFEPDIILTGKGIASGYAPLGAVLVAPHIVDAFERGTAAFMHGFTYQAHPVATAAGNAVFDYLDAHKLFERVAPAGESLYKALVKLESHPHVGQVRGLGLLQGVEFVKDKNTREPFPKDAGIAEKIRQAALENGVLLYPGQGTVDGSRGDHVLLAPPFVIQPEEGELIADALRYAVGKVFAA
jgi:adenosylmethionine-8-amino-7-oxononanoate aminotransferase